MAFDWEELLLCIEDRRVVPVVGRELLRIEMHGEPMLLDQYVGGRLREILDIDGTWDPPGPDVNQVVTRHLERGGDLDKVYSRVPEILKETGNQIPPALDKLAKISDLTLFVSTTSDRLVIDALDAGRSGGQKKTTVLDYTSEPPVPDLPENAPVEGATVFRLFGGASAFPEYAVSSEDHLEFLRSLQDRALQPTRLFTMLRNNNLLLLGCGLPNWLVRFFVRTVKNERLTEARGWKFVADELVRANDDLVVFLELFKTQVHRDIGPERFVDELYDRWVERRPKVGKTQPAGGHSSPPPAKTEIFLSYAREDSGKVKALKESLEAQGLTVWFDDDDIPPAGDWQAEIETAIRRCPIFMPCLSRHAEGDHESFFRKEWKAASDRYEGFFGAKIRFLWPVVLDDLPPEAENLPDTFRKPNWTRIGNEAHFERLVTELRQELRKRRAELYR